MSRNARPEASIPWLERGLSGKPVWKFVTLPLRERREYAEKIASRLLSSLSKTPPGRTRAAQEHLRQALGAVVLRALEHAERTEQWRAEEVVVHLVQDELATELWPEVSYSTARKRLYRAMRRLAGVGLLRLRPHVATLKGGDGRVLYDGTVVRVRLTPGQVGQFMPADFSHPWRDLMSAIVAGKTFTQKRREVSNVTNEDISVVSNTSVKSIDAVEERPKESLGNLDTSFAWMDELLASAVPVGEVKVGLADDVRSLEFAVEGVHHEVDRVARRMGKELGDSRSIRYFAGLLWKALRAGRLQQFAQQLERLLGEMREGGVKKPGALLASRMGKLVA